MHRHTHTHTKKEREKENIQHIQMCAKTQTQKPKRASILSRIYSILLVCICLDCILLVYIGLDSGMHA